MCTLNPSWQQYTVPRVGKARVRTVRSGDEAQGLQHTGKHSSELTRSPCLCALRQSPLSRLDDDLELPTLCFHLSSSGITGGTPTLGMETWAP